MKPNVYLRRLAAQIVKRSGICRATVEAVLPHVFDAIRYEIVEGQYHCVPIESFGTFAVVDIPEREYHHTIRDKIVRLPAKRRLKFAPTRNMRLEIEEGKCDGTRHSFSRHPKDPAIRKRASMGYHKESKGRVIPKGTTIIVPKKQEPDNFGHKDSV